ncbi:hypothetical protein [Clostridium chromiireducens]|nr:hypothetical protein [Clostridium chromiireducens]
MAQAASDGAEGTTDIAQRIADVTLKSSNVLELSNKYHRIAQKN